MSQCSIANLTSVYLKRKKKAQCETGVRRKTARMIRIEQGVSKKNNDKNWPTEKLQGRIISVLEGKKKLRELL
jgi:hypothetical protein